MAHNRKPLRANHDRATITLMKLASLKAGRDGRLVVVSDDLAWCAAPPPMWPTLQSALDNWAHAEPILRGVAESLAHDFVPHSRFHERDADAPLPRAFQWADGSAYVNHVELVRKARGAELPASFWNDPLMYQGGSDNFLPPRDPIAFHDVDWGLDFEAEVVVVTGDVPQGATREQAIAAIQLIGLVNDVSLRGLIPDELAKGFGFVQSKPASALSPVFVTPEALGDSWKDGKLHGVVSVDLNGQPFGRADAGEDMTFDFGMLISHLAKTRSLGAGSIIGSGTISNRGADGGPGQPVAKGGRGYNCIAEQRMVEAIEGGAPVTPWLKPGDVVRIEMLDANHHSIFGAIEQTVAD
jgi:fumarylacetoacetate (FAA) hydrolase